MKRTTPTQVMGIVFICALSVILLVITRVLDTNTVNSNLNDVLVAELGSADFGLKQITGSTDTYNVEGTTLVLKKNIDGTYQAFGNIINNEYPIVIYQSFPDANVNKLSEALHENGSKGVYRITSITDNNYTVREITSGEILNFII